MDGSRAPANVRVINVVTIAETLKRIFCWSHKGIAAVPSSFRLRLCRHSVGPLYRSATSLSTRVCPAAPCSKEPLRGVSPLHRVIIFLPELGLQKQQSRSKWSELASEHRSMEPAIHQRVIACIDGGQGADLSRLSCYNSGEGSN